MKNTIQKDSMKTRKSIRTYTGEKISAIDKEKIIKFVKKQIKNTRPAVAKKAIAFLEEHSA